MIWVLILYKAQQKKDREAKEKEDRLREERAELQLLEERGKPRQYRTFY